MELLDLGHLHVQLTAPWEHRDQDVGSDRLVTEALGVIVLLPVSSVNGGKRGPRFAGFGGLSTELHRVDLAQSTDIAPAPSPHPW